MKKIKLFFILISLTTFSQTKKIVFEYEVKYILDNKETLWNISKKNPKLMLIKNITFKKDFLYYQGKTSSYNLNENNEIIYDQIEFGSDKKNKEVKITKYQKKEIINNLVCSKYEIYSNDILFEVFINEKNKVNNITYINSLIGDENNKEITPGLIVKVNIYSKIKQEFRPFMNLQELSIINKTIIVDLKKLDFILRRSNEAHQTDKVNEIIE